MYATEPSEHGQSPAPTQGDRYGHSNENGVAPSASAIPTEDVTSPLASSAMLAAPGSNRMAANTGVTYPDSMAYQQHRPLPPNNLSQAAPNQQTYYAEGYGGPQHEVGGGYPPPPVSHSHSAPPRQPQMTGYGGHYSGENHYYVAAVPPAEPHVTEHYGVHPAAAPVYSPPPVSQQSHVYNSPPPPPPPPPQRPHPYSPPPPLSKQQQHAYNGPPPLSRQHHASSPLPQQQYAYTGPPSATAAYMGGHYGQAPASHPPSLAQAATAPVSAQHYYYPAPDNYAQQPHPPHTAHAGMYYKDPPLPTHQYQPHEQRQQYEQHQPHPPAHQYQPPLPSQQYQSHQHYQQRPPHSLAGSQAPTLFSYSQTEAPCCKHELPLSAPTPPLCQPALPPRQPTHPSQHSSPVPYSSVYGSSDAGPESGRPASFYGTAPAYHSPPPQQALGRHSSLRQPMRHSPVPQQLQRHYSLATTEAGGGIYGQKRDTLVQNHGGRQHDMSTLVGSMGTLSLAQQPQQQPGSVVLSQPTMGRVGGAPGSAALAAGSIAHRSAAGGLAAAAVSQPNGNGQALWESTSTVPRDIGVARHAAAAETDAGSAKHALVVGINYYDAAYSQTSNINGAHAIRALLIGKYGYSERNVTLLSDDQTDERCHPTHHAITAAIGRIMRAVRPGDTVFFYFCGFGRLPTQLQDCPDDTIEDIKRIHGDYILPCDFESAGAIDSEFLHAHLVRALPPSVRLTALFNCVVEHTALGLPFKYSHPADAPASDSLVRSSCTPANVIVFGWDREYNNPRHRMYLTHTPSNLLGNYWAAAMDNAVRSKGTPTIGDIFTYLHNCTQELVMLPFVACAREISMSDAFVV